LQTKYARKGSAVYAALAATKRHPSAESLYEELKAIYPNLSRTTVYANLKKLQEEGSVVTVGVVDGRERYDAVTEPHPHFICECCGEVSDVEGLPDLNSLVRAAEEKYRFRVQAHELTLRGMCEKCRLAGRS